MLEYVSNTGGGKPVNFETAILDGFAIDGGLYVPTALPQVSPQQLEQWKSLSYVELAFEVLSLFIDRSIMSAAELKQVLNTAYADFEHKEIIPIHQLKSRKDTYVMELFHGPTISFKDVGLAFLVNLVNFFLQRKNERLSLIVATTGDTGPATAYFSAGKSNLDAWILYPKDKITEEQERQMTCLPHANIHPVGVANCPEGSDDLDEVIAKLYANKSFKNKIKLGSVNSINWGRIMMQTVHYFYGYFHVIDKPGEKINMSVPSGGFGNVCAGSLARKMGLPISKIIVANNENACLHRIFSEGKFSKEEYVETPSSAIDILIPFNFWRYLYFCVDQDAGKIKVWLNEFQTRGTVTFDKQTYKNYSSGFLSYRAKDQETLDLIAQIYHDEEYLLDPHGAVSVCATDVYKDTLSGEKTICFATAHPSKFPVAIGDALKTQNLPIAAQHPSIEAQKLQCEKVYLCDNKHLESALIQAMEANWDLVNK
ncbi:threonine synthase [Paraglaciecola marina]|uniref:threonine synthase n=1 Tax=Paraglaciecola marina TaxID=2500157 RepID=UPI0010606355|nr:threonine synthase [Paraglaciecola marina]